METIETKTKSEKIAEYIKYGGNHCLACKSDNVEGGYVDIESGIAKQEVWCNECGSEWKDEYHLVNVVFTEERTNTGEF